MTENLDLRDNISISLRRDKNTAAIKKLVDEAPGRDFTEKVMRAVRTYLAEDNERTDREYREDKNKSNKGDSTMTTKEQLVEFIRDEYGDVEFKHVDTPLEDCSSAFLKGYVSTRLDVDMETLEDRGIQYLRGLSEASNGKVDVGKLKRDSKQDMRKDSDRSKADQNRKALGKMYSQQTEIQDSELKKRVDAGEMTKAEALRKELKDMHASGNPKPEEDQSQAEANKEKLQNMHEG